MSAVRLLLSVSRSCTIAKHSLRAQICRCRASQNSLRPFLTCSQQRTSASAGAYTTTASPLLPQGTSLPLSERPAEATAAVHTLLAWHRAAAAEAEAVGPSYADADGGPSSEELLIELNWLLDDAVAACRLSEAHDWQPATWRQLESGRLLPQPPHDAPDASADGSVALRADIASLRLLWQQRLRDRVPLQYLNNCCHWRDLILAVGPSVLIPRPETELLIDFAQQAMKQNPELAGGPWLDLGTGSGAIAIGLASILPAHTQVYAVDKSSDAIAWAQLNLRRLKLGHRIQVMNGSWYGPVQHMQGMFAGIVSNPPYIPSHEMTKLQAEVGQHEPWLALDGGQEGGLNSLGPICHGAAAMLQPGGFLALETAGGSQAKQVVKHLKGLTFEQVDVVQDLAGVDRFVTAYRAAAE